MECGRENGRWRRADTAGQGGLLAVPDGPMRGRQRQPTGSRINPDDDTALDVEEPPVQEHKQTSNLPLHKRIAWADEWDLSGFNASARSLLLRLAIHYDVKAGCCRYSQAALSERMGVSTDTVSRSLRELEEAGVITVERSHRKTNRYILDFSS